MNNRLRIVRDGVPSYVAPWVSTLSPAARKMIGTGPSRHDPQGQLGLPIPDMDSAAPMLLDFGNANIPAIKKEQRNTMSETVFAGLVDLQHKLYREGNKDDARVLWELLATVVKA